MLTLKQAAEYVGYSPKHLWELAHKGLVRHYQRSPHSPLKFKQEWLDEFIAAGTKGPKPTPKPSKARLVGHVPKSNHGIRPELMQ